MKLISNEPTLDLPPSTSHLSLLPTLYCPVFYLPRLGRDWMGWTYYRSLRRRISDFNGTRAVFATWLYPDGVAAARLARDLAAPCWIMVQGSDIFHLRHPRRLRALLRVADDVQGFICVSRPLAETLIKAGIHRAKVHVVPNGVDGALFRYRTKREAGAELGSGFGVQGSGFSPASERSLGCSKELNPKHPTTNVQQPTPNGESAVRHPLGVGRWALDVGRSSGVSQARVLGSGPGLARVSQRGEGTPAPASEDEARKHMETACPHAAIMREVMEGRRRLILFVGNLVPVKGPDVFLKSLLLLQSSAFSLQPIVSVLIGDGPMRRGLEREARRLGLGDSVLFLGSRSHAEVARWMNVADVLCLTSRSEGMPNVVIEALVSGLPVVVTDVGACRELVEDEPLARWCLPEDPQALARAMGDLLSLSADRPSMAARHGTRFSWERQARRILELMGGSPRAEGVRW